MQAVTHHTFQLWSGGFANPVYPQLLVQGHSTPIRPMSIIEVSEGQIFCSGGGDINEQGCTGGWSTTIAASATDGFCHTWPPGTALAYDSLPAVKVYWNTGGDGYAARILDQGLILDCLQLKNDGTAFPVISSSPNDFSFQNGGMFLLSNSIVDSNSAVPTSITEDDAVRIQNTLCVNRYTGASAACVTSKYQTALFGNTFVQLGGSSNGIPIFIGCMSQFNSFDTFGAPSIRDNIFIGWVNPIAWNNCIGPSADYNGNATSNNASSWASGSTGSGAFTDGWSGNGGATSGMLGTSNIYSQIASATFVNPTTDFRLKGGAPSLGAGANYSVSTPGNFAYTVSTFDMFGTARGANPIDLGPVQ